MNMLSARDPNFPVLLSSFQDNHSSWTRKGSARSTLMSSARFGVSLVNLLLVLVQDGIPLNLLCCSDHALATPISDNLEESGQILPYVCSGPFIVSHDNSINDLNSRQFSLASCFLELFEDNAVQLLVMDQLFKAVALDAVLLGKALESRLSRDDDCNWLVLVRRGVDTNVRNDLRGTINRFKLLRQEQWLANRPCYNIECAMPFLKQCTPR